MVIVPDEAVLRILKHDLDTGKIKAHGKAIPGLPMASDPRPVGPCLHQGYVQWGVSKRLRWFFQCELCGLTRYEGAPFTAEHPPWSKQHIKQREVNASNRPGTMVRWYDFDTGKLAKAPPL